MSELRPKIGFRNSKSRAKLAVTVLFEEILRFLQKTHVHYHKPSSTMGHMTQVTLNFKMPIRTETAVLPWQLNQTRNFKSGTDPNLICTAHKFTLAQIRGAAEGVRWCWEHNSTLSRVCKPNQALLATAVFIFWFTVHEINWVHGWLIPSVFFSKQYLRNEKA